MNHKILIAGCGSIGLKLALKLATDHKVFGLKRNAAVLPATIEAISADVTQPQTLKKRLPSSIDYVVYCLSPGVFNDGAYRTVYVEGLRNLIEAITHAQLQPKRLFFVSSTSVYHQAGDQWVDELSETHPTRFSGQRLVEAEQVATNSNIPATSVRFSGIYGGNRTRLLEQVQNGTANSDSDNYTNRIHEDDCVAVLAHLIERDIQQKPVEACYVASDSEPVRMSEVVAWLSKQMKVRVESPHLAYEQPNKTSRGAGSKRCSNSRLKKTGYQFKYPSFRDGYTEMIQRING